MDNKRLVDKMALIEGLKRFNLSGDPFEAFELYYPTTQKVLNESRRLFQDREGVIPKIFNAIITKESYRCAIHGEVGVGKSSVLNRLLYELENEGYFAFKFSVPSETGSVKDFEKELLKAAGSSLAEKSRKSQGLLNRLASIFGESDKRELEDLAILSLLYASESVTLENRKITGTEAAIGAQFVLKGQLTSEEEEQITVSRSETLSDTTFNFLIHSMIKTLKSVGYRGVLFGIDEADHLTNLELEPSIIQLLRGIFYSRETPAHLILVLKKRNGQKPISSDIIQYKLIEPLGQDHVLHFLEELYLSKAVDKSMSFHRFFDEKTVFEIYRKREGKIRDILQDLSNALQSTLADSEARRIGNKEYQKSLNDTRIDYVKTLSSEDTEYKILKYLITNQATYARDPRLETVTGLKKDKNRLRLKRLTEMSILAATREKARKTKGRRKTLYYIEPAIQKEVLTALK